MKQQFLVPIGTSRRRQNRELEPPTALGQRARCGPTVWGLRCAVGFQHEYDWQVAEHRRAPAVTIGMWNVKKGDSFKSGDVVVEIQTDKATMGFEAQDPGAMAKILIQAGQEATVFHHAAILLQWPTTMLLGGLPEHLAVALIEGLAEMLPTTGCASPLVFCGSGVTSARLLS